LPHVEYAYNRAVHSTTKVSPFQIVYGFNPRAPIDLLPLPTSERINHDAKERAYFILKLHEKTKENIEKVNERYRTAGSKGRKDVKLEQDDLVWLHLRKDHFPELRKSKLMPRADGPFKILGKVNDNAYKLALPPDFGVSATFNFADLTPHMGEEDELESMMTALQEGEDDKDITPMYTAETPPIVIQGPITRARARQLHQQVSSFPVHIVVRMVCYLMILLIILYLGTLEMITKALGTSKDQEESKEGAQVKMETQFNSDSTTSATSSRVH
jgi:hypothetical protein